MSPEYENPFAYGIEAPIGSVTPLFHLLKDAEGYIAKLTDSRDKAKIIPLYLSPTLTDAERKAVAFYSRFDTPQNGPVVGGHAATLRGLLERLK